MKIDYPTPALAPQMIGLWQEAFGDSMESIEGFFCTAYSPARCRLLMDDNGQVVAGLYWLDVQYKNQRFAYLYAVAVRKNCRGKGYSKLLLEDTHAHLAFRGYDGVMLYPGEESLRAFYEKFGYKTCTTVSRFTCEAAETAADLHRIDRDTYAALRRTYLPETGVIQEEENIAYLENMAFFYAGEDFVLAASTETGKLYCPELLGNADAAPAIVKALNCAEGTFVTPGKDIPFTMLLPLHDQVEAPDYLGLVFN